MSRLEVKTPDRAQAVVEQMYRNMERRIAASPPGLCPVDMAAVKRHGPQPLAHTVHRHHFPGDSRGPLRSASFSATGVAMSPGSSVMAAEAAVEAAVSSSTVVCFS